MNDADIDDHHPGVRIFPNIRVQPSAGLFERRHMQIIDQDSRTKVLKLLKNMLIFLREREHEGGPRHGI